MAAVAFTLLGLAATPAAQALTAAEIDAQYQADVQRCNSGAAQDKQACLREAGAARDAARQNSLTDANTSYNQNQLQRCQSLPQGQREECMKQMSGQDTQVMGSVDGGGVLRETIITIPPAPTQVPGTAAQPSGASTMPVR
jgi:hypothetical protein